MPPPADPEPPRPSGAAGTAAILHDWGSTPLGDAEAWPQALKTVAGIVLGSNVPMLVAWGPELLLVHNDAYGEILGDRRPALGRPLAEVWADAWDAIGPNTERVMRGETVFIESAPRPLRRGGRTETAWLTSCYNPVIDEDGEVAGIFGVVTAVDEDQRVQQRLRESEERFRLIADAAPVPMWVTQLDRKRSFVNRAYVDFLAISYDEAVDFDWRTIIHPDDHDRIIAESIAGEASLKPFVLEGRYRRHDGAWRWLRSTSQPRWGPGGEHIGFIGVAHDVTEAKRAEEAQRDLTLSLEARVAAAIAERERAEEALRQSQKMEAVGRLTGGIAHDFNNLLTPVIGGLEVLHRSVDDPRLKRLAEAALESGRRGAKLTTQLLAFSRIQRIRIAPVAVDRVIENLREILLHTIGPGVAVRIELGAGADHALCDENQLENAILNLAINARDAMPEGGTLTISTGLVAEPGGAELAARDYVRLTVADTGHGMPPDIADRATEPFFSTKPLGKGTGLGLAQVYGIARQSGGTVRIESREGEGTAVHVLLPRADGADGGPAAAEGGEAAPRDGRRGARVLVVDDDAAVRAFIAELLDELGHRAEIVPSAQAALAAIAAAAPDLVLIDFAMPDMNGAELACALRERWPELPIAFVTGFAESDQLEAVAGGDLPVLRKPFGIDALAALVAASVGGRD